MDSIVNLLFFSIITFATLLTCGGKKKKAKGVENKANNKSKDSVNVPVGLLSKRNPVGPPPGVDAPAPDAAPKSVQKPSVEPQKAGSKIVQLEKKSSAAKVKSTGKKEKSKKSSKKSKKSEKRSKKSKKDSKKSKKSEKKNKTETLPTEDKPERPEKLSTEEKPPEKPKTVETTKDQTPSKRTEGVGAEPISNPIVTPETDEFPTLEEEAEKSKKGDGKDKKEEEKDKKK
ncbi:hypothetical protein CAEBREN_07128 [Caenorhabditis brenneri]|uniref:Uncharacterized protein n=1 Tax=Caenorhabditis brenneri TaxID=135651 RepID=G0NSZ9_CAEBE|nr:hypothetical protein CAEBREN_07128 [Caenorhabditis brenneri]